MILLTFDSWIISSSSLLYRFLLSYFQKLDFIFSFSFSNTPSLSFSLPFKLHVSEGYVNTGNIRMFYWRILVFLDRIIDLNNWLVHNNLDWQIQGDMNFTDISLMLELQAQGNWKYSLTETCEFVSYFRRKLQRKDCRKLRFPRYDDPSDNPRRYYQWPTPGKFKMLYCVFLFPPTPLYCIPILIGGFGHWLLTYVLYGTTALEELYLIQF